MSYTIDVYRGDARAQRSIVNFGTFVTLFPQLIAGPILKYKDLGDQIDQRDCTAEKLSLIHILEQLPHLVKQHDGHGFQILPAAEGPNRCV